jgi:mono/diheme cytochrome c family protein
MTTALRLERAGVGPASRAGPEREVPLGSRDLPFSRNGLLVIAACACFGLAGCQQKMAAPAYYPPLGESSFFADGRASRPLVPGTIARGHLRTDVARYTGKKQQTSGLARSTTVIGAGPNPVAAAAAVTTYPDDVETFPFAITEADMARGKERYTIYCAVCHDALGYGQGKIVERGYTPPPSYHIERLRRAPVGHFFQVITNGYGSMPDYKEQVPPHDRWAIAAYIRALQLSQHFPEQELSQDMRQEWQKQGTTAPAGGQAQ